MEVINEIRGIDPRNRSDAQHKFIREHVHLPALKTFYDTHGVGDSIQHKLAFWESTCPDGYSMSHNPTDQMKVTVFEESWIVDNYPQDAILC